MANYGKKDKYTKTMYENVYMKNIKKIYEIPKVSVNTNLIKLYI